MGPFSRIILYLIMLNIFCATSCYAYRARVHSAINASAITQKLLTPQLSTYFQDNFGYSKADDEIIGDTISDWFRKAGKLEDEPGFRTKNHFLDPVNNNGFSGLIFGMIGTGEPTAVWAQKGVGQQSPGGAHSWLDARQYFYTALTSDTTLVREQKLTDSFRALGQVMHLVSDMSVPEHTRDNSHIRSKTIEPWLEEVLNPETKTNLYAKYSAQMSNALNNPIAPDPSLLQQAGLFPGAPIPIANLFDFEKYTNSSNPSVTTSGPIGLAEYSNANFFSINTIFKDYNYPSEADVIEFSETDTATGEKKTFISSSEVSHLAQTNVFYKYLVFGKSKGYTLEDDRIHADYMDKLIPRAVGYAGALIDYFYRGSIELTLPARGVYALAAPDGTFNEIRVKARNNTASGEEMTNGTFQLVVKYRLAQSDPFQSVAVESGPEQYIVLPEKSITPTTTISRTSSTELVFDLTASLTDFKSIPLWATDVYLQVVFKGQLGNETGAVVVGFKDISEPTPIDVVNNMDHTCINNSYLLAGSPEAITAADTDHNGTANWDVFPHGFNNVYVSFNNANASLSNYSAKFAAIPPGNYGRVFVLADFAEYALKVSTSGTVQKLDVRDLWNWSFGVSVDSIDAVINQYYYPSLYTVRGLKSWWYTYFENPVANGSICDNTVATPDLIGPAAVILH